MTQPKITRDRAKRVELALKGAGYWDHGESYALADILCDLRHLCDREGWCFGDIDSNGHDHYLAELHPDDIEQNARAMHREGDYPILPAQMSGKGKAQRGVALLIEARDLFKSADNKRTVARIASAISSARGAVRIQEGRSGRAMLAHVKASATA